MSYQMPHITLILSANGLGVRLSVIDTLHFQMCNFHSNLSFKLNSHLLKSNHISCTSNILSESMPNLWVWKSSTYNQHAFNSYFDVNLTSIDCFMTVLGKKKRNRQSRVVVTFSWKGMEVEGLHTSTHFPPEKGTNEYYLSRFIFTVQSKPHL